MDLLTVYQNSNYDASDGDYFDTTNCFSVDFTERQIFGLNDLLKKMQKNNEIVESLYSIC